MLVASVDRVDALVPSCTRLSGDSGSYTKAHVTPKSECPRDLAAPSQSEAGVIPSASAPVYMQTKHNQIYQSTCVHRMHFLLSLVATAAVFFLLS